MYLVMAIDGRYHQDESALMRGAMRALTDGLLDDPTLNTLLERCKKSLQDEGAQARLQAVGSRICGNRMDRETAFTLAAAVALADQRVAVEESDILSDIAEYFGVADKRQRAILREFDRED